MEKCDVGPVDPAVEGDRLRSLQIVQMKAEMRMLLEGARSADATWGGGESLTRYSLCWIIYNYHTWWTVGKL